jgi:hypothetical protein
MTAHPRPMPLADLRAVCADMGYSTFHLDRANAERARRICALGKARAARDAMRLARRALNDFSLIAWWPDWEEHLADARDELRYQLSLMNRHAFRDGRAA